MSKFEEKYNKIMEILTEGCKKKKMNESDDGDKKVENEKELTSYAMEMAKEVFGDETDEEKVKSIVKNAIEKATKDGNVDWGSASGIVQTSFTDK